MMIEEGDFWCNDFESPDSAQKMKKFDEMLNLLRRQFKRLLKENKKLKDTIGTKIPKNDSETSIKPSVSKMQQDASELVSKSRKVSDDIPKQENINSPDEISISDPRTPTKSNQISIESEIPEILSLEFDSESEKSLMEQFERSKSSSYSSEQLQKSPVLNNKRPRQKKSQSPRVDLVNDESYPNSAKKGLKKVKKEPITEIQRPTYEEVKPLDTTKSLFTSFKGKEDQTFVSPQRKPYSKLGITKLYNVSTTISNSGSKLKQTKLIFKTEEESTDVSNEINFSDQATNGDSIFDLSLFNKDSDVENMDIIMEDQFPKRKCSPNAEKNTTLSKNLQALDVDDFVENSPKILNCARKIKKQKLKKQVDISRKCSKIVESPQRGQSVSKILNSRSDVTFFAPVACSTQISLPKNLDICSVGTIDFNSDTDTHFFFDTKKTSEKSSPEKTRKIVLADVSNTSPQKPASDNREDRQSQEILAPVNETMLDDETFFSPGECQMNAANLECFTKPSTSVQKKEPSPKVKRTLMTSFDRVPESKKRGPDFVYALPPVRKKSERMELAGWSCWDCKKYYDNLQLSKEELQECMKYCSRHKAKHDPEYHTQPGFWNPVFTSSYDCTLAELERRS